MKSITIATFISNNEKENSEFYDLVNFLKQYINIDTIIFSNQNIEITNCKVIVTPRMTKYRRIQMLLNESQNNDILCLDNDITPSKKNILEFINKCLENDYSIAWGKIKAKNIKGFIPKLINIDKNLSHDFIRPLLWKLNLGISLPGQIFMINKKYLENELPDVNTVYDDLMIGAKVREKKYPIFYIKDVLGHEKPKLNIKELIKQRIRWGRGLAETIVYNKSNNSLPYILLHGFMFNLLWLPIYTIIILLSKINIYIGLALILLISYLLAEMKLKDIIWSISYMIIFPFVYLIWEISLIINLLKINVREKSNSKNNITKISIVKQKL